MDKPNLSSLGQGSIFHVTHWKAGSQWIYQILSKLFPGEIIAPRVDQGQFLVAPIKRGYVYPTLYLTRAQFDSVQPQAPFKRFVVIRDLRDTLISAYFSLLRSHAVVSPEIQAWRDLLSGLDKEEGLLKLLDGWLPLSATIQASWANGPDPVLRYEDLIDRDCEIFEELLLVTFGLSIDPLAIKAAVETSRFGSGRTLGVVDASSHQRTGLPGDWKNHFSSRLERAFNDRYADTLVLTKYANVADTPRAEKHTARTGLTKAEVLDGYDLVSSLHPHLPSLNLWRSWECAALRRFSLDGDVINIGCSDGAYFRRMFPDIKNATGIDFSDLGVDIALLSETYESVVLGTGSSIPLPESSADYVLSSLALSQTKAPEIMVREAARCLRPGGRLLCSVLTDRFKTWSPLPYVLEHTGHSDAAEQLISGILHAYRLESLLSRSQWGGVFRGAGLEIETTIGLLPRYSFSAFLMCDAFWHIKRREIGEFGDTLFPAIGANEHFRGGFRKMIEGLLDWDTDLNDYGGVVFVVRKN